MRSAIDIGIDAQHRRRAQTASPRQLRQNATLFLQLKVELADAGLQRVDQLPIGLSDPGKDHIRRRNACIQSPAQLAARHDVGPVAALCEQPKDSAVGVGLDREGEPGGGQITQR